MKRVLAIFLSAYLFIGSIIPGNSFFELSSLPSLIKHYQYHRTVESPGISLVSFLKMHYSDSKHQKSDPANHCNLPLQHQGNISPVDEIVNPVASLDESGIACKPVSPPSSLHSFLPDNQFASGIFHPPSVLS